jgi:hypothetical protein
MVLFDLLYSFFAGASWVSLFVLAIGLAAFIARRFFLPDFSEGGIIHDRLARPSREAR